jgi:hypothetical protein
MSQRQKPTTGMEFAKERLLNVSVVAEAHVEEGNQRNRCRHRPDLKVVTVWTGYVDFYISKSERGGRRHG